MYSAARERRRKWESWDNWGRNLPPAVLPPGEHQFPAQAVRVQVVQVQAHIEKLVEAIDPGDTNNAYCTLCPA